MPKILKGGTLWGYIFFEKKFHDAEKNSTVEPSGDNFFSKKSHDDEKKLKGGTLQSRPVLYLTREKKEKPFWFSVLGQQVQFGETLNFCITFGRTILVTSGVSKKKLTKNHDYSRDFSQEKRQFKKH